MAGTELEGWHPLGLLRHALTAAMGCVFAVESVHAISEIVVTGKGPGISEHKGRKAAVFLWASRLAAEVTMSEVYLEAEAFEGGVVYMGDPASVVE